MEANELQTKLSFLFRKAANASLSEYVFTILRVQGITCKEGWNEFKEPENIKKRIFEKKEKYLSKVGKQNESLAELMSSYVEVCSTLEPYHVLANLIRVSRGSYYTYTPFGLSYIKSPFAIKKDTEHSPSKIEIIQELVSNTDDLRWIAEQVSFIDEEFIYCVESEQWNIIETGDIEINSKAKRVIKIKQLRHNLAEATKLYESMVILLQHARLEFLKIADKAFTFGDYSEEFHFLTNNEVGLYGFKIKRPSGTDSEFTRTEKGTNALNMHFGKDGQIEFFIGDWDEFRSHPTLHATRKSASPITKSYFRRFSVVRKVFYTLLYHKKSNCFKVFS